MQESGRNPIIYRERQMLKQDKIQTFSAMEEPAPDWNDKPMYNGFNCKVFNKSKLFFILHPGEHMQKYSAYADLQFASSCVAPSWSLNLRWLLLPPSFFSSFFFPSAASKARVIKAVWAREREGGRGRERKNEWKLPNEQKNAQTGLSTQTKAMHHKFAPSFFSSEQNFCQTDSTSQLTLSLPVAISISDPQARVHNIAALSWPK